MDIIIMVVVILLLVSSSVGAYFMMSGGEESTSSSPYSNSTTSPPPPATPPPAPPVTPPPAPPVTPPPAPINANVGDAISCTGYTPKGAGAIYRYDGDRKMRWYPDPDIAGSWDPNWASGANRQVNCTGFTLGDDVKKKKK